MIIVHFFFSLCSVWEDTLKIDSSTACCKKKRERGSPLHMCAHSKTLPVSLPNPPCLVPSELCSFLLHVRLFMTPTAVLDPRIVIDCSLLLQISNTGGCEVGTSTKTVPHLIGKRHVVPGKEVGGVGEKGRDGASRL